MLWLQSVAITMGDVTLRFSLLPPEHRVVVTSSDVKAATGGKYYLRTYDNSGGAYARLIALCANFIRPMKRLKRKIVNLIDSATHSMKRSTTAIVMI